MDEAIRVFVVGICGVFAGMLALYLAIKAISFLASRLPVKEGPP